MKQRTLKKSFTVSGKGLHTGLDIVATFKPAPLDYGYKIQRIDIDNKPIIDAVAENIVDTRRCTILGKSDITISTTEHAFSALYALGVDNCLIEINGPEFPILNGSSIDYVNKIKEVSLEEQSKEKDYFIVQKKIEILDPETGSKLILLPDENFCINSFIEFDSKYIPNQSASLDNIEDYEQDIAKSRTFVFVRDIQGLRKSGLIKGGDLSNAVVIYEKEISQKELDEIADDLNQPHHDAKKMGYLNPQKLIYPNEPARHKILDIIGDISLIGKPIKGRIIATKPGHKINVQLAKNIRKIIKLNEVQPPIYDPAIPPIMDINKIKEVLPHRYPFLLVDKIIEITDRYIVGIKNITVNEPFFVGHFPKEPVFPGVLHIEALAQTGGLMVLSKLEDPERYSTYFLKINDVKFRQKVVPGDTLIFRVEFTSDFRRGIATMRGLIFVKDKIVSEANFTAQIVKNK